MNPKILLAQHDGLNVLKFCGEIRLGLAPTLGAFINRIGQSSDIGAIVIDLRQVTCIDSTMLGCLAKVSLRSQEALNLIPTLVSTEEDITRILMSMGLDSLFAIVDEAEEGFGVEGELPIQLAQESDLCEQIIEAHRVLMSLNQANESAFRDLVESLEGEQLISSPPARAAR